MGLFIVSNNCDSRPGLGGQGMGFPWSSWPQWAKLDRRRLPSASRGWWDGRSGPVTAAWKGLPGPRYPPHTHTLFSHSQGAGVPGVLCVELFGTRGDLTLAQPHPSDLQTSPRGSLRDTTKWHELLTLLYRPMWDQPSAFSAGPLQGSRHRCASACSEEKRRGQCLRNGCVDSKQTFGGLSEPRKEKGQAWWQRGGVAVGQGPAERLSARTP